jgi:hypothetical protein
LPIEVVRPLARGRATQHPVRLCRWDAKRGRSPRRGV